MSEMIGLIITEVLRGIQPLETPGGSMIIEYPRKKLYKDCSELYGIFKGNAAYGIVGDAHKEVRLQLLEVSKKMKLFYQKQVEVIEARHEFITGKPLFDGNQEKFKQKLLLILGD